MPRGQTTSESSVDIERYQPDPYSIFYTSHLLTHASLQLMYRLVCNLGVTLNARPPSTPAGQERMERVRAVEGIYTNSVPAQGTTG